MYCHLIDHTLMSVVICCIHRKLKREAELIQAGHLDPKLEELWGEIVL